MEGQVPELQPAFACGLASSQMQEKDLKEVEKSLREGGGWQEHHNRDGWREETALHTCSFKQF